MFLTDRRLGASPTLWWCMIRFADKFRILGVSHFGLVHREGVDLYRMRRPLRREGIISPHLKSPPGNLNEVRYNRRLGSILCARSLRLSDSQMSKNQIATNSCAEQKHHSQDHDHWHCRPLRRGNRTDLRKRMSGSSAQAVVAERRYSSALQNC